MLPRIVISRVNRVVMTIWRLGRDSILDVNAPRFDPKGVCQVPAAGEALPEICLEHDRSVFNKIHRKGNTV